MPSRRHLTTSAPSLPEALVRDIERAGYYPTLVVDVIANALAGDEVVDHLVHLETSFDNESLRRHVTVLVTTPRCLVVAHADDQDKGERDGHGHRRQQPVAFATTERVPLTAMRGVLMNHVIADPTAYRPGDFGREVTLTIGWAGVSRVDLFPAACDNPSCEADHGYEGTLSTDDISLRISTDADGQAAMERAFAFARSLSASIGRR